MTEEGKTVDNDDGNLSVADEDDDRSFQKLLELSSQWDDDLEDSDSVINQSEDSTEKNNNEC